VSRDGKTRDFTVTARPGPSVLASVRDLPDLGFERSRVQGAFLFHGPLMDMSWRHFTPRLGSYFGSEQGVWSCAPPLTGP